MKFVSKGQVELHAELPILAWAFARKFAQKMGRSLDSLTPACVGRLKAYGWPGNVRELENVIERAVITARDGSLDLDFAPAVDKCCNLWIRSAR